MLTEVAFVSESLKGGKMIFNFPKEFFEPFFLFLFFLYLQTNRNAEVFNDRNRLGDVYLLSRYFRLKNNKKGNT